MPAVRNFFAQPFGSAVAGGLVVLVLGWAGIASGAIHADGGGSARISQPPLMRPAADTDRGKALTVGQIYERDSQGVAFIQAEKTQNVQSPLGLLPQKQRATGTGSGFVIDDEGHVLTNAHVVEGAEKISVKVGDREAVDATVVGADPSSDVALLELSGDHSGLRPLELGDSSKLQVGDPVVAIGNPFGLESTVTSGIVSALQREISAPNGFSISDVIQTDAPINPGNSGGPLLDASGRVVGINSQIETGGGQGSVGIGFAVPANTAEDVVDQLLSTGEVKRAFLGVSGGDVTDDLQAERGALVQEAYAGGPAAQAGLQGGDVIVEVNGEDVTGMDDVVRIVNEGRPGEELTLAILRDGDQQELKVTLGERPAQVRDSSTGVAPQVPGQ